MTANLHQLAEARSLALHAVVATRIKASPDIVSTALERVDGWLDTGAVHPAYATAWKELLSGSLPGLLAVLTDPGERATALRQCSPFAGVLDPRTRWRIWREAALRERAHT